MGDDMIKNDSDYKRGPAGAVQALSDALLLMKKVGFDVSAANHVGESAFGLSLFIPNIRIPDGIQIFTKLGAPDNAEEMYLLGERAAYARMLELCLDKLGTKGNSDQWRAEREELIVALAPLAEAVGRPIDRSVYLPDQIRKIVDWALAEIET